MTHLIRTILVYMLLIAPSFAKEDWKPINKLDQVPSQVKNILSDCFIVTDQPDEWLNVENLALIDLGEGKQMWFSTCERSASQQFSAIAIETSEGFHRASFPQFIDGEVGNARNTIPGAGWHHKTKTLHGQASGGCAGHSGGRWKWKWTGSNFRLVEQAESEHCIGPDNWPVVYQAK